MDFGDLREIILMFVPLEKLSWANPFNLLCNQILPNF